MESMEINTIKPGKPGKPGKLDHKLSYKSHKPKKSYKLKVAFGELPQKHPDTVNFPKEVPRYLTHVVFLNNLIFKPENDTLHSRCDHNKQYEIYEDDKYICVPMPDRSNPEELLKICKDFFNFLNIIIKRMLNITTGKDFNKIYQNLKSFINIRRNLILKIKDIITKRHPSKIDEDETQFFQPDTNDTKFRSRATIKGEKTIECLRDSSCKDRESALEVEEEVKRYLSKPPTIFRRDPSVLSDYFDSDNDSDGEGIVTHPKGGLYKTKNNKTKNKNNKSNNKTKNKNNKTKNKNSR